MQRSSKTGKTAKTWMVATLAAVITVPGIASAQSAWMETVAARFFSFPIRRNSGLPRGRHLVATPSPARRFARGGRKLADAACRPAKGRARDFWNCQHRDGPMQAGLFF